MTRDNAASCRRMLDLVDDEGIDKFYLSHLVYAGRGNKHRERRRRPRTTRAAMDLLFERAGTSGARGTSKEFVTGNNDADGVYFLHWVRERFPESGRALRAKLGAVGRQRRRASTSPTSTTSATSTPTPSGGTTPSAT